MAGSLTARPPRSSLVSRTTTYPSRECRAIFSMMVRRSLAGSGRMIGLSPNRATKRATTSGGPSARPWTMNTSSDRGPSSVDADAHAGAALDPGRPRWAHGAHLSPGGSHDLWRHARFDWPSVDWNHDRSPPLQRPRPLGVALPGAPLAWERQTRRRRSPSPLSGAAPEGMVLPSRARRRTSSVTRHDAHRPDRGPRSGEQPPSCRPGPAGPTIPPPGLARAHEVL
jgi:hypothetical protein